MLSDLTDPSFREKRPHRKGFELKAGKRSSPLTTFSAKNNGKGEDTHRLLYVDDDYSSQGQPSSIGGIN